MSILNGMPQPLFEVIGVAGFILYMLAYAMLQTGKITGHGYPYTLLNLIAASLVLTSLICQFNLASFLIQVSWITISVYGLMRRRNENLRNRRRKTHRSTPRFHREIAAYKPAIMQ